MLLLITTVVFMSGLVTSEYVEGSQLNATCEDYCNHNRPESTNGAYVLICSKAKDPALCQSTCLNHCPLEEVCISTSYQNDYSEDNPSSTFTLHCPAFSLAKQQKAPYPAIVLFLILVGIIAILLFLLSLCAIAICIYDKHQQCKNVQQQQEDQKDRDENGEISPPPPPPETNVFQYNRRQQQPLPQRWCFSFLYPSRWTDEDTPSQLTLST